jgi:hypothetical protein
MKTRQLTKKIGTAILGLSVMAGIGFATSTTTQAQSPWQQYQRDRDRDNQDRNNQDRNRDNRRGRGRRSNDEYPNWGGSFQLRQTALNAGYNEGIKDRNRRRHDFRDFSAYQKATKDYNSRDGDRELYRRYFREAFQNGFDAGINGY